MNKARKMFNTLQAKIAELNKEESDLSDSEGKSHVN